MKGGKIGQVFLFGIAPVIVRLEIKLPKTRNALEKQRENVSFLSSNHRTYLDSSGSRGFKPKPSDIVTDPFYKRFLVLSVEFD
jgi:hypothetical protein